MRPPLVLMLTIVLILCVPVYSEAGTDQSHPHAMLQLLFEATGVTPPHHHAPENADTPSPQDSNGSANTATDSPGHATLAHPSVVHSSNSGDEPAGRSPDSAELSTLSPSSNLIGIGLIPRLGFLLALSALSSLIFGEGIDALTALLVAPEPPPPRPS